jgi:hypothetical protein
VDALVIHAAGDLRVEDVPAPPVLANQVRARVRFGGINTMVAKELDLRGRSLSRAVRRCGRAAQQGARGREDVISTTVPNRDADRAFALAADRSRAMKVLPDLG